MRAVRPLPTRSGRAAWSDRVGKIARRLASLHLPCQTILPTLRWASAHSALTESSWPGSSRPFQLWRCSASK